VEDFFIKLIQRVMPKSDVQCRGELTVTRKFFENFAGDNARFLFRSFNVSGDHDGQASSGYRWPYGNVAVIAPFNFPVEIPALQTFGSLLAGNRPLLKCATKVAVCMEQFLLMAAHCGMPAYDVNFINCSNDTTMRIIDKSDFHMIQFTGGSEVSEIIANKTNGKVRVEDAGFDWKVLGPDVSNVDYVAWTADQDTYAASGQKCSKQSVMFVHENWVNAGLIDKVKTLAARRKLSDLTIGPVLTWDNKSIKAHIDALLKLPESSLAFGGKELTNHKIPKAYGSYEPTAVQVSVKTFLENFELCATELFGPFQVIVPYKSDQLKDVLRILNKMKHNLTAGVVSNDPLFLDHVLGQTINGTTYAGLRARTTGAPQNHWFGPCGDPRGAGIGTKEAILHVWTAHREIIRDYGPIDPNWKTPECS
jgi:1-pyrroline-5-carboxylate dehydrogenase